MRTQILSLEISPVDLSGIILGSCICKRRKVMGPLGCILSTLLFSVSAGSQIFPDPCNAVKNPFAPCMFLTRAERNDDQNGAAGTTGQTATLAGDSRNATNEFNVVGSPAISTKNPEEEPKFRWGRALFESFTLFSIEQAYVVHDDWRWVGGDLSENGVPFNHYWRDYKQSLSTWVHSGWNDGDPHMYGYVGHPIQGVATSYIYLQNDPKSEKLEFSKTKAYWKSRLKATVWNAVYSTEWNIGPLSEMTIEKYGTHHRPPWNQNGTWPCTRHCLTGVGQIDVVMTPVGGLGWLVGEDFLDKSITRRVEAATRNRFLIDVTRLGLDPIRAGTNMLHGKRPWYRPRDTGEVDFSTQPRLQPAIRGAAETGESH